MRWPKPPVLVQFEADYPALLEKQRLAPAGPEKMAAARELREREQAALQDLRISWLRAASSADAAAPMKWVLFLSDVYVVSAEKVQHPGLIWRHFDLIAAHAAGGAPELTKAISRSPAMDLYLDLQQNRREAPNENFARELFELFVLGQGNYTERDIKESARAFTGYRVDFRTGEFHFVPRQHDPGVKAVFGQTGAFTGDDVIDLAYTLPAAAAFLPGELSRFYLTDEPLPPVHRAALGARWREHRFDLGELARLFFGSRQFFAPELRGEFIKSPVQLYLGLLQDLAISVPPLPRFALFPLRQMGQQLFQPPNVRGWVGGRSWISASTLAARRQIVRQAFAPLQPERLNADEVRVLAAAGPADYTVPVVWSEALARLSPAELAREIVQTFVAGEPAGGVIQAVESFLQTHPDRPVQVRSAVMALLESPAYQLC